MKHLFPTISLVLLVALSSSCYYDSKEDLYQYIQVNCDTSAVTYSQDVAAILSSDCVSCHNTSVSNGNLDLSNYSSVKAAMDNGKILDRVNRNSGDALLMPPGNKLSDCKIQQLTAWSNAGAPNN